ncbi:EF-hand domain-containing protein [Kiloniella sp. EL199]|uniref:EF-hand domain-containing protein n=1 Tax=Kiloniella sp. EL199 TaxID=2107581 RepID=UPI000EA25DCD|nr:EF-hand domain-containing protein [Kiloniella sp. EL199]
MISKKTLIVAGSIAFLTAGAAFAAGGGKWKKNFEEVDANGDGQITQQEIANAQATKFSQADLNNDGSISLTEMQEAITKHIAERTKRKFDKMDADNSGGITAEEFNSRINKMVEHLDRNNDGIITQDEMPKNKWHKG